MSTVSFITVDVFTAERFAGNQLAVIPDARGLSEARMQAIATEFGYSEVTFVLPPENPENTARVRIFTPTTEVPSPATRMSARPSCSAGNRKSSAATRAAHCVSRKRRAWSK